MTADDFNTIAWRDFLVWAWAEPEMRDQFALATGLNITPVRAPIDAAIDAATGAGESLAASFIEWATRAHWGVEHAPKAYQEALAKRAQGKNTSKRNKRSLGHGG